MLVRRAILLLLVLLPFCCSRLEAQSLDISAPTPITASDLSGSIGARDIGDARRTDHFYAFVANPGDLIVTIESRNLNGDVDVFTAVGLRPLLKFTVYAESSSPITKSIFLQRREDLILRIEARSPNDDEGVYRISFGGSFEALPRSMLADSQASESDIANATAPRTGRRVSSVGARIDEPPPAPQEVAAAPTPDPTPEPTPAATEKPAEASPSETTAAEERETPSSRRTNPRRPPRRSSRSRPANTDANAPTSEPSTEKKAEERSSPNTSRPSTSRRNGRQPAEQPSEPTADVGPRLVIETADGTLIDRSMTTVRRVMVENGWVVVVGKDGAVQRILLSQIVRMSIAP